MLRLGVIDIGSNTSTLAVYAATADGGLDRLLQVGEPLRLMRKLGPDRRFPEAAMARTVEVIRGFVARAAELGARCEAVATSAVRDAVNQEEFLARLREVVPVRILDGESEGVCAVVSAVNLLPLTDGFVIDQGGGSLQIAHVVTRRARQVVSLPLGALRLTDAFLTEPVRPASITALRRHVVELVGNVPWFRADAGGTLVAVGGSVRALAKMDRRGAGWPLRAGHGYRLTLDAVEALWEQLSRMHPRERELLPGLAAHRADTVVASAFTWFLLMRVGGFDEVRVSSYGLREGVAFRRVFGEGAEALVPDIRLAGLSAHLPGDGAGAVRRARALVEERGEARWAAAITIASWARAVRAAPEVLREAPLPGFWQEDVLAALDLLETGPPRVLAEMVRLRLRTLVDLAVSRPG